MVTAGGSELRLSATVPRLSGLRNNVSLAAGRFSEPAALVSMLAVSAVAGIVAGEFTDVPLYATESLFVVSVAVVVGVISFVADGFSRLVTSGLAMAVSVSAVAGPTISWLVAGVVTDVSRFVVSFVAGRFSASFEPDNTGGVGGFCDRIGGVYGGFGVWGRAVDGHCIC